MSLAVNVELENNPQYGVVVSSRRVAQGLSKRHGDVLEALDQILENGNLRSLKNCDIKANIIPATYTVANQKRKYREYLLAKDGFTLYMFNIQGYNDFKWAYIQKFNEMEAALANVSKPVQQQLPMETPTPARKTWNGVPVMTTRDVAQLLQCSRDDVQYWARLCKPCGLSLVGEYLRAFKQENKIRNTASQMLVLYRHDVEVILHQAGRDDCRSLLDEYFTPDHALDHEDMRFAVRQADLLFSIAREIKDPVVKEMNLKAVTALLIDIGLWNEKHAGFNGVTSNWDINSLEGWNKDRALNEAKRYWKM